MDQQIVTIKQSGLRDSDYDKIINLKSQYWKYAYESQIKWINDNICDDDIHVLLYDHNHAAAYLTICHLECIMDGRENKAYGIGSVCVDQMLRGRGYGIRLVKKVNEMLIEMDEYAFLLCRPELISFYKKCGWYEIKSNKIMVNNRNYNEIVMSFNCDLNEFKSLLFNKNF